MRALVVAAALLAATPALAVVGEIGPRIVYEEFDASPRADDTDVCTPPSHRRRAGAYREIRRGARRAAWQRLESGCDQAR